MGERGDMGDPRDQARHSLPHSFSFLEGLRDAAVRVGTRFEQILAKRNLTMPELEIIQMAREQQEECDTMLDELGSGNLTDVIQRLKEIIHRVLSQHELLVADPVILQGAHQAIEELKQAQEKILH